MVGGRPLICHTLDAALKSGCFTEIILSSDDHAILQVGSTFPGVTLEERPAALADDRTTAAEVLHAYLASGRANLSLDAVALLLPTAPFRSAEHIADACDLLTPPYDGVISVVRCATPPQLSMVLGSADGGVLRPLWEPSPLLGGKTRSQDQEPAYCANGAIYLATATKFLAARNFFVGCTRGFVMDRMSSIDIDDEYDLEVACLLANRMRQGAD